MEKMTIDNLMIEITRRCNMQCQHCLRGDPQNKDIPIEYIDTLFSKLSYISSLSITGGEPSLKPEIIINIIELAEKHNVDIGGFDIVTNGKHITIDFLSACINLYAYCSDNEMSSLSLSTDDYHESISDKSFDMLTAFRFFHEKGKIDPQYVINEGNAKRHGIGNESVTRENQAFGVEDNIIGETEVYLNCKGNIVSNCDFSYRRQDVKGNIVCHVNDMSIEKFKSFSP